MELTTSQKFTLGYAALVGVGGLMGYLKSGSQKSLIAGGGSAAVLYYVYRELPENPVVASSVGVGLVGVLTDGLLYVLNLLYAVTSAALTGMMGSRFIRTGKVFPAGIVSLVSLVMTGGYLHGIFHSSH